MKTILTLIILFGLITFSCKENNTPIDSNLSGKWHLISIQDNLIDSLILADPVGNVDITFSFTESSKGKISGSLTALTAITGNFNIDQNKTIAVPVIYFKYAFEPLWGSWDFDSKFSEAFADSKKYTYDSLGNLSIYCGNEKVLNFIRQ